MKRPNKVKYKQEARKAGADARKEIYEKLTVKEKLTQLDKTFGNGQGAAKHRAKLNK